jgi:DNA polymerase-4/DNA polymerase V
MNILRSFTNEVEVCSIDEAFVDLTGLKKLYKKNYIEIAQMIRSTIFNEINIPVSIGISSTKTLAKLASDKAKNNNGIFVIGNAKRKKILSQTYINDISGVGKKLDIKMKAECIFTALDFISRPDYWIKAEFHKHGMDLKNELLGVSLFKLEKRNISPISIQQTAALKNFTSDIDILKKDLISHIHKACKKARQEKAKALFIEVMLRDKGFRVITEKIKLDYPSNQEIDIIPIALKGLNKLYNPNIIWRSTGIGLFNLVYKETYQNDLFYNNEKQRDDNLGKALDELEDRFGKNIIRIGA